MCEFDLIIDGKVIFTDVISAKAEHAKVIVRDILGESRECRNCRIEEVDVDSGRLVLSKILGVA